MTIAERIYQYIEDNGLKHASIAKKLGMSRQTLCNKLKGRSDITAEEYFDICHALDVPISTFETDFFANSVVVERKTVG